MRPVTASEAESPVSERNTSSNDGLRRAMSASSMFAEFSRIMHACIDPAAAIGAALDVLQGRGSDYWESRPSDVR